MVIANYLVWSMSALLVVLLAVLALSAKGQRAHALAGTGAGVATAVLLAAVIFRGYFQYGQQHGDLYPLHLLLGSLFFAAVFLAVGSGLAMWFRIGRRLMLYRIHSVSAYACAILLLVALGIGIASRFSHA